MTLSKESALIETDTLEAMLGKAHLKILDATYHIPPSPRQAQVEFEQQRIPGALFFDIDAVSDPQTQLPHMLPNAQEFEKHMTQFGIENDDTVIIYDCHGLMSAPRVWWMFRFFGHKKVYVLNGGLPKWVQENRPTETGKPDLSPQSRLGTPHYKAEPNPELLIQLHDLKKAVEEYVSPVKKSAELPFQLVDMRPAARFSGEVPEPRPGLKQGHIPGSVNSPWTIWLNSNQTLKSPVDLQATCDSLGLDWQRKSVMTCGSGITACMGALAFYELGNTDSAVYDGSWAEWGSLPNSPIA